jgi:hypothetical protein
LEELKKENEKEEEKGEERRENCGYLLGPRWNIVSCLLSNSSVSSQSFTCTTV